MATEDSSARTRPMMRLWVAVHLPLRALARVEGDAGGEEGVVGQRADALDAFRVELLDLAELGFVGGMRAALRAISRSAMACSSRALSASR